MTGHPSPESSGKGRNLRISTVPSTVPEPTSLQDFSRRSSYDRTTENRGVAGSIPALAVPVAMRDSGRRRRLELAFKRRRKGDEGRGYGAETRSWRDPGARGRIARLPLCSSRGTQRPAVDVAE